MYNREFFFGVWHGLIFIFSLLGIVLKWILSIFDINILTDVTLVGKPNTGWGYGIGYFIGLIGAAGFGEEAF